MNTLFKNANVVPSLLQFANGTNFSDFEKCSIITKTYKLCYRLNPMGSKI
jgi:hypothetical protein